MGLRHRFRFFFNLDYHYAFVQVILMVVSILIAFWVDTWWQDKQDLKKEKSYVTALKSELEENQLAYKQHVEKLDADIASSNGFLLLLQSGQPVNIPSDSLQKYLWPLFTIDIISPTRAVLDDLVNSGGMQYIQSDILRRQIATYKRTFEYDFEKQRSTADLWDTQLSVFNLNNMNLSQVVPAQRSNPSNRGQQSVQIPSFDFPSSFSLSERKEYANRLVQRILLINNLKKTHAEVLNTIRTLLFQLELQLNPDRAQNSFEG